MGEWCLAYRTSVDVCVHITSWRDRLRERIIVGGPGACTCIRTRLEPVIRDPGNRWGSGRSYSFSPYITIHRAVGGRTDTGYRSLLQYHCDYPPRRTLRRSACSGPIPGRHLRTADTRLALSYFGHAPRTLGTHLGPGFTHILHRSVRLASPLQRRPRSVPSCPMICDRRFCLFPRICPCQTSAIAFRVRIYAGCFGHSLGP